MDSQFLKFWGNYLLAAATGQRQLEDLNQWISQGFSGFEELTAMFRKYYGLEAPAPQGDDASDAWQRAAAEFSDSFNAYLKLMGVVSQSKYRELEQKYNDLEKKVAEQEETIKILRDLLAEEGTYQGETIKALQELVNNQADAFEKLMRNVASDGDNE